MPGSCLSVSALGSHASRGQIQWLLGFGGTTTNLQQGFWKFYVVNRGKHSIFIKYVSFTIEITWLNPSKVV